MEIEIPIKIITPNKMEHWRTKYNRHKKNKKSITQILTSYISKINLPVDIYLTRIAPRKLDYDNLVFSLKSHRDIISDLLIPGLRPGYADGDERLRFHYAQEKRRPKEYLLKIKIIERY